MVSKSKTKDLIKKTREYINYIEEHVENVRKAWEELKIKCKDMSFICDDYRYFSIEDLVDRHDASKLSEEEFVRYRKYFYPTKEEEETKRSLSKAFEHHKKENDHHWQTWTEKEYYNPYSKEIFCVEMILDWMAMGYKFGDTSKEYYEKNKDKIYLPDWSINFIYEIFDKLK